MNISDIFLLIDGLRARGVQGIEYSSGETKVVLVGIPPLRQNELPASPEERQKLLQDPRTPEAVKQQIAEEDNEDLYGAA